MNKQPAITAQTRSNLLEAFWSLFEQKPIDQITVKAIAARAGYNRGTFYQYFRDVYHCLECVEQTVLPALGELPPIPDGRDPLFLGLQSFATLYQDRFRYYSVLLGERGDPGFQRTLINSIKATIVQSRPTSDTISSLEFDFELEYILCGMIGVLRHYYATAPGISVVEMMAMMYRLVGSDSISGRDPGFQSAMPS